MELIIVITAVFVLQFHVKKCCEKGLLLVRTRRAWGFIQMLYEFNSLESHRSFQNVEDHRKNWIVKMRYSSY